MKKLKITFLIVLSLVAAFDLLTAYGQAIFQLCDRKTIPMHSLGFQFLGLKDVFKDIRSVGYFTDKDLDQTRNIAQFELAQYTLAPTVLMLNHTEYHWVIFDCTSFQTAMDNIKRLGLTPLKAHNGIILAYNPNGI